MFNQYYQDELTFLKEQGEEFARSHPTAAHFLSASGNDPDVERLLEGFAFLTGRIREKLDDELPEVTHGLMSLLWPHYLRPIPAMSILELKPVLAAMRGTRKIPRGVEVQSVAVEGTQCRFRSAFDVDLQPISLEDVSAQVGAGPSSLRLGFRVWNQVQLADLEMGRMRLFLHGDSATTQATYLHLCRHAESVRVTAGRNKGPDAPGIEVRLEPGGLDPEDALLPYPPNSFPGYRVIQEFFALPEKFHFVDLVGLDGLQALDVNDWFEVQVQFDRQLEPSFRPTKDDIRLNCTPIVNLFAHESDPIRLDREQAEYRLRPAGKNPLHFETYSIDHVVGYVAGSGEKREFPHCHAFVHGFGEERDTYHYPRIKSSVVDGRIDTYLSFVATAGDLETPDVETVSAALTCKNRNLADGLRVGDINLPTDSSPEFVQFSNLTVPTQSVVPPLGSDLHWRLISHLSLNAASLASIEALRGILDLYNYQALNDAKAARTNALRLEGMQEIHTAPREELAGGCIVRGIDITIDVLEDRFSGDGDLYIFGTVLNEFVSLYAALNSFTRLTLRGVQRGEEYTWPARIGQQPLL